MNQRARIALAKETLSILEQGQYINSEGDEIDLSATLEQCLRDTRCFEPEALDMVHQQVQRQSVPHARTDFAVSNESTLSCAARLLAEMPDLRLAVLNFASAKTPGGGFLNGSQAQEESLARSSALYPSLLECPDYYNAHHAAGTALYSDRIIYSPRCPVFRDDAGRLLDEPYLVDFITSAAPNAGALRQYEPHAVAQLPEVLARRSANLLNVAAYYDCDALLLGAWGCGVFQNDPVQVADAFAHGLAPGGAFHGRLALVMFAVLDRSPEQVVCQQFADRFQCAVHNP